MYLRTYKPSIQVQDSYDKVYGQKNHRNYTSLQKQQHRQMNPELYLDDVELYDKNMYKQYLFEEAADVEAKEEYEKHHKYVAPVHELMLQITLNNQIKTHKLLKKIKAHEDAKKAAKKAKVPEYLQIFEKFNQVIFHKKQIGFVVLNTSDFWNWIQPEQKHKTNLKCKECQELGIAHGHTHQKQTGKNDNSIDLIATLIKRKNNGK